MALFNNWSGTLRHKKQKKIFETILAIIFWDILMFEKIFLLAQVKRCVIIGNNYGIYKLSHDLLNNSRLRTLGNLEISRRCQNFMNCTLLHNLAPKIKIFSIVTKNSWKIDIELFSYGVISQKNCSLSQIFWPGLSPQTLFCF